MSDTRWDASAAGDDELSLGRGLLLYTPLIFAGNMVGLFLQYPGHGSAVLYPPYAALTAALIAAPRRQWVWYLLIGVVGHFVTNVGVWPLGWIMVADVANITRALVAALLILRFLGPQPRLDSVPSLCRFVAIAALIAPAIGATIGATNVFAHQATNSYRQTWNGWFISNALTALTLTPFLIEVLRSPSKRLVSEISVRRFLEAAALGIALVATCVLVYVSLADPRFDLATALYAPIPILLWTGLRFGPARVGLALSVLTAVAIVGTDQRTLTVANDGALMRLQVFVFLTAMPMLCVAVVATARQRAVHLYRALLASLQDQVAILDARGNVITVNDSWQRHAAIPHACPFERSRAGDNFLAACECATDILTTLHPEEREPPVSRVRAGAGEVLAGTSQRFEMEYERAIDSQRDWFTLRIESLAHANGGAVVTRSNITARRQAHAQIEEQRRQLSHLGRVAVLGQLSGALAHELRQPLSAILANAEAARRMMERDVIDVPEIRAILRDVISEDRRAAGVIDGLRAMHRREDLTLVPIPPGDLVREALGLAHAEIITRGVQATGAVEPELPLVMADRVQILHVLLNLVLNGCESMSDREVPERLLSIGAARSGANVCFSVRDCGTGIPPELVDRLFEPFVTSKREGLGLGLSIARAVVDTHGGRIWAENASGSGATLHFLLPAVRVSDDVPSARDAVYVSPVSALAATT